MKQEIILPDVINAGTYDASAVYKNASETRKRMTSVFEIELPVADGGSSFIDGNEYPIRRDRLICAKPGQRRFSKMPFRCLFIHMTLTGGLLYDYLECAENYIAVSDKEKYKRLLSNIIYAFTIPFEGSEVYMNGKLMELIYMIHRDSKIRVGAGSAGNDYIMNALKYIDAHITENITLEQLAENQHISPVYFHRIFTKTIGRTPYRYILDKRLTEAKKLLLTSDLSCLDIAQKTGFSSQSYFNYTFKKETGITPVKYKKQSESKYPD